MRGTGAERAKGSARTNALGYRLWILPPQAPCPCLGGLGYWLPGLGAIERDLLRFVLLWLAFTAWGVLMHHRLTHAP